MQRLFLLSALSIFIAGGCKKPSSSCPSLQGRWLLSEYYDGSPHPVSDTSSLSETLVIDNQDHFTSYSTRYHIVLNEGVIYCDKVFDADSSTFKKGSPSFYNQYVRF